MNEFQNMRVTVVVKNTKGKIYTLNYSTPQAMCEYLPREFEDNDLVIMMVGIGNQIVWTALGANKNLTLDDVMQFFN